MASPPSQHKRRVLAVVLKLLILMGIVIFSIPFISSLYQNDPNQTGKNRQHYVAQNVSNLPRGELIKIKSFSSEVWVYHRTQEDIAHINEMSVQLLRHPSSKLGQQPPNLLPGFRSLNKNYFVFIPFESQKQCQVQLDKMPSGHNGFVEVCYRGVFDTAGRALKSYGHRMQHNLSVPAHLWQDEYTLLLDRR